MYVSYIKHNSPKRKAYIYILLYNVCRALELEVDLLILTSTCGSIDRQSIIVYFVVNLEQTISPDRIAIVYKSCIFGCRYSTCSITFRSVWTSSLAKLLDNLSANIPLSISTNSPLRQIRRGASIYCRNISGIRCGCNDSIQRANRRVIWEDNACMKGFVGA